MKVEIEKQLVARLKIIGLIVCVCAVGSLVYKYIPQTIDEYEEEVTEEVSSLNPFFVSAIFSLVGTGCVFISWKKKKSLFSSSSENKDPE
jgi:hypothetical protein